MMQHACIIPEKLNGLNTQETRAPADKPYILKVGNLLECDVAGCILPVF